MGDRRMFSRLITSDDKFTEMPLSSQCLYFHLGLEGDDEGFVSSPKWIMRGIGCNEDDLKILIAKGFVIPFESGVIAIRHWYVHNTIRKDRMKNTLCKAEITQLMETEEGIYELKSLCPHVDRQLPDNCQPSDRQMTAECPPNIREVNISKDNINKDKGREGLNSHPQTIYGKYQNVFLTDNEHRELQELMGNHIDMMIERLSNYMASSGKTYKNHKATLESWYEKDRKKLETEDNDEFYGKYKGFKPAPKASDYENEYDFCNLMRKENANE